MSFASGKHSTTPTQGETLMTILEIPKRLFAGLLVTALLLAACGGGDETSAEDQEFIDAMTATFSEEGEVPDGVDTTCVAEAFVSALGGANAIESNYGITAADAGADSFDEVPLSEPDARGVVDGMWKCDGFEDSLYADLAGSGLSEDDAKCLQENIDDGPLKTLMASSFMGDAGEELARGVENGFEANLFEGFSTCNIG